ncbi:MAG: Undecaprenyl-phosphate galactose phosphotransferase [Gemmatimonadetes bacterium]|nr:Undecaprenyl-phosphate galactose phosphotransferase [Gemmatimonadota bacterium]
MRQSGIGLGLKRVTDLVIAGIALVVAAPLLLVIAAAIAATIGRPVLFVQVRPGRNAQPFRLIKFRTMRHVDGAVGDPRHDASRLTRFGRFLRSTSLDELPELLNVLAGTMSLVGPRPLLMQYLPRYTADQMRRHEVLPGLTGWAQINGRNATTWEDRFRNDLWYVDHWSPWLDFRIIALTLAAVAGRRGVSQEGHATMPEFHAEAGGASAPRDESS